MTYPDSLAHLRFPEGFSFGVATSAYQIEGGAREGGRGASVWDEYARREGTIEDGSDGSVATDHYHRLDEDLDLLRELGVDSYRFSISWSRIQPVGTGVPNREGLRFYRRLIEGLIARGIKPVATLFHWDLPQALEDRGGWLNRETVYAFEAYTRIVAEEFGELVPAWGTINEPWCVAFGGYGGGGFAPGRSDGAEALKAAHHLNLAHGLAVRMLREYIPASAQVSITLNFQTLYGVGPGGDEAARKIDGVANRVFSWPILKGQYPEDLLADTAHITDWSFVQDGDLEICAQPIDWLGFNYYSTTPVALKGEDDDREHFASAIASQPSTFPGAEDVLFLPTTGPHTAYGWNIYPKGLVDLIGRVSKDFPAVPLMITENGAAFHDEVETSPNGTRTISDYNRIDFFSLHLTAIHAAIEEGADVRGYFAWTLLDNFEWNRGYTMKFGLVHVDPDTKVRTPKASFGWYRDLIRQHS